MPVFARDDNNACKWRGMEVGASIIAAAEADMMAISATLHIMIYLDTHTSHSPNKLKSKADKNDFMGYFSRYYIDYS